MNYAETKTIIAKNVASGHWTLLALNTDADDPAVVVTRSADCKVVYTEYRGVITAAACGTAVSNDSLEGR